MLARIQPITEEYIADSAMEPLWSISRITVREPDFAARS